MQKLTDIKIEGAKEDLEINRGQIVASPARLKADMDAATRAVEEMKGSIARLESDRKVVVHKSEIVTKADKDVVKTMTLLAELEVGDCNNCMCASVMTGSSLNSTIADAVRIC